MLASDKAAEGFPLGMRVVVQFRAELIASPEGVLRAKLPNGGTVDIPWNAELVAVGDAERSLTDDQWYTAELDQAQYPELRARREEIVEIAAQRGAGVAPDVSAP